MRAEQLQEWLREHEPDIAPFMDYEILFSSEAELQENLGAHWFRDPSWNQPGYRFVSLGQDGTGGEVAVWVAPRQADTTPVVLFGSEGGAGVVAASPLAFARALAYGPLFEQHQKGTTGPARLSLEDNWFLSDDDPESGAAARAALARYRLSAETRLGPLPPFEMLVSVPPTMQSEFRDWVTGVQGRVARRDAEEQYLATERKRQSRLDKARRFAVRSATTLPPNAAQLRDGSKFTGNCAGCGDSKLLRLVKFEDLNFGLCVPCYFSNAW